jgi:hypothetical protein
VYSIWSKPYVVEFLGEKFLCHMEMTLDSPAACIRDSLRIVFVTLARKLLAPCPWDLNPWDNVLDTCSPCRCSMSRDGQWLLTSQRVATSRWATCRHKMSTKYDAPDGTALSVDWWSATRLSDRVCFPGGADIFCFSPRPVRIGDHSAVLSACECNG